MFVPEILYRQPLAKDRVTQQIEVINERLQVIGSNATIAGGIVYTVPNDRFFFFSNVGAQGFPEALSGARSRAMNLFFQNDAAGSGLFIGAFAAASIGGPGALSYFGGPVGVWLPPGARITAQLAWDNDFAGNVSTFTIHGVTIPRGNMARG